MPLGYRDLYIILRAENLASSTIAKVGGSIAAMGEESKLTGAQLSGMGSALISAGTVIGAVGAIGLDFFAKSTQAAIEYSNAAALTQTQTQGLGISLQSLMQIGEEVASKIPEPFDEMQEGLYNIFSSLHVNLPQAQQLLTDFAKAGVAGQTDLSTVSKSTISELNAFKLPISDVNNLLDIQFEMVKEGRGHYSDFVSTIGNAIPVFAAAGQTIQEMSGDIAFVSRNGATASSAVTESARAVEAMQKAAFQSGLQSLGINYLDATGKAKSLNEIVTQIAQSPAWQATVKSSGSVGQAFVDTFGAGTIQARRFFDVAIPNYKAMNAVTALMYNSKGQMQDAYDIMFKQPQSQIQLLKNNIDVLRVEMGQTFLPVVNKVAEAASKLMGWFEKLSPGTKRLILEVLLGLSAFATLAGIVMVVGGAFLMLTGAIMTTLDIALLPAIGVIGAMASALILLPVILFLVIKYHRDLAQWAKDAWKDVSDAVKDAIAWFEKLSTPLKVIVGLAAMILFGPLIISLGLVVGAIIAVIKYHKDLMQWAKDAWKAVSDAVKDAIGWFDRLSTPFKIIIAAAALVIAPILGVVFVIKLLIEYHKDLMQWGRDAWKAISDAASNALGAITDAVGIAAGAVESVVDAMVAPINAVVAWFQHTWTAIMNWWHQYWPEMAELVKEAVGIIASVIKAVWSVIGPIIIGGLEVWVATFRAAWNIIATVVSVAWTLIKDVIAIAFDAVDTLFNVWWAVITGTVQAAWDIIVAIFKTAWDVITSVVKIAFDLIKGIFDTALDLLTGHWSKAWSDMVNMFSSIFGQLATLVNQVFNNLISLMDGLLNTAASTMNSVGEAIINGLWQGIQDLWHLITDFFSGMWKVIENYFKDAATWLLQAGKDIITGLITGITNAGSGVGDALKGIATGAIHSFMSVLGIGSPSKVFMELGDFTAQGYIQGLLRNKNLVNNTAAALIDVSNLGSGNLANTMQSAVSAGLAAGGSGVNITIPKGAVQVTIPVGAGGTVDSNSTAALQDAFEKSLESFATTLTTKVAAAKAP